MNIPSKYFDRRKPRKKVEESLPDKEKDIDSHQTYQINL